MSAVDGMPAELIIPQFLKKCGKCGISIDHFSHSDLVCDRIAKLESDNGELRTQLSEFKSSDEGHIRAREMDEKQIKELIAENRRLRKLIPEAFRAGAWWKTYDLALHWPHDIKIPPNKIEFLQANGLEE
jgi:hypothetical protein